MPEQTRSLALFNDEPTLKDKIGRSDLVAKVGTAVAACQPPQVVGVHGEWGCGKTSFLHQLQLYLTGECPQQPFDDPQCKALAEEMWKDWCAKDDVVVVWFEAWRYQHDDTPVVALLQEIRAQLAWKTKLFNKGRKIGEVAIQGALFSLEDLTKKIGIQASKVQEVGEKWEQTHLAYTLPSHVVRQHLEHAIGQLIGKTDKNKKRLVVLVDDLDRCEAETAYKLLEGIKIYLNLPSCIFVLGMNQQIIEGAIKQHLPKGKHTDGLAQAYMEKLCQNIWHLPVLSKPESLLCELLKKTHIPEATRELACQIVGGSQCLPRNSRKITRFANTLMLFLDHASDPQPNELQMKILVVMANLYLFHHKMYRMLEVDPGFYMSIKQWAMGAENEHQLFKNLALTHKYLAGSSSQGIKPVPTFVDVYADPTDENVFRVQQLICDLDEGPASEIEKYIIR